MAELLPRMEKLTATIYRVVLAFFKDRVFVAGFAGLRLANV
jgi:hypothetical protein